MSAVRKTPEAINNPLMILRVERMLFCLVLLGSFVVMNYFSWIVGCSVLVVSCLVAQGLTRMDERLLEILRSSWNFPSVLDPYMREPFEVEITK